MGEQTYTVIDLQKLEIESREVYIERALYAGQTIMFVGAQKTGKSYFAEQLSACMAAGVDWGNGRMAIPKPLGILYVLTEGTGWDMAERLNPITRLLDDVSIFKSNWMGWRPEQLDLSSMDGIGMFQLIQYLEDLKIQVLFIDSLYSSFKGSVNSDETVSAVASTIGAIKTRFPRLSIVILHHEHRKHKDQKGEWQDEGAEAFAGSWVISAMGDAMWMYSTKGNEHELFREFETGNVRSRLQGLHPFRVDLDEETGILTAMPRDLGDPEVQAQLKIQAYVNGIPKTSFFEWTRGRGVNDKSTYRHLKHLRDEGIIDEVETDGVKTLHMRTDSYK